MRGAVKLGLIEAMVVLLFSLVSRLLDGVVETVVLAAILLVGAGAGDAPARPLDPARTIEGIAGAAGIGLGARVRLPADRRRRCCRTSAPTPTAGAQIGGGSNWWYHPVWWMVGTFLPWMGAWILANQLARTGGVSAPAAFGLPRSCLRCSLAVVAS